jgi:NAD(P)-dependent dehydrogenase (short-subunit alcohol dehydrogenase family)
MLTRNQTSSAFDLTGRVAVITGGAGLLGVKHAEAIAGAGGIPVLADRARDVAEDRAAEIERSYGVSASAAAVDVTKEADVAALRDSVVRRYGRIDILINNAANNPALERPAEAGWSRVEHFDLAQWNEDLAVGLTGAFLCAKAIGPVMAAQARGVILNVASDLAVIAPDQRLYRRDGIPEAEQPVKPISYSVVKTGLLGLTRYLATYWCDRGVRVNAISPGGVYNGQPDEFVQRLSERIPLARMARADEYQGAIVFLCSDASSYMTGANLVIDGGRSAW